MLLSPFVLLDGQPNANEKFFNQMLQCIFKAFYKQYRRVHENVCSNSKPLMSKRVAKSLFVSAFVSILAKKKSRYKRLLKFLQDGKKKKNKNAEELDIAKYQEESTIFHLIR